MTSQTPAVVMDKYEHMIHSSSRILTALQRYRLLQTWLVLAYSVRQRLEADQSKDLPETMLLRLSSLLRSPRKVAPEEQVVRARAGLQWLTSRHS